MTTFVQPNPNQRPDVKRDRWGRPLLICDDGDYAAFTRASTLSGAIESTFNLEAWKMRQVAIGLSARPDLVQMVAVRKNDKKALAGLVESALEVAASNSAANMGTVIHSLTEDVDNGNPIPDHIPKDVLSSLDAYVEATKDFTVIEIESFVGDQEVYSAGTYDRLVELDGVRYIADLKTGQHAPKYAHGAAVQMSVYANGTPYDVEQEEWLAPHGANRERAIMIHLPYAEPGVCNLYWVDIERGYEMAKTAYRVRRWWKEDLAWSI